MAGKIGVYQLKQVAPVERFGQIGVARGGAAIFSIGRFSNAAYRKTRGGAIISKRIFSTHSSKVPAMGLRCDTLLRPHGNAHVRIAVARAK